MGDIKTASGSKLYIGPAITSATDTLAEFRSITSWVEIGLIENLGEVGDEAALVTGAAIGDARVRKAKGARDGGNMTVVCFHDPEDAGQIAAIAAADDASNSNYAFKLTLNDPPVGQIGTIEYFRALVMGERLNVGTNDNIMRRTFNLAVNSAQVIDPST